MKRFTETQKWRDPWFQPLPPEYKLFWLYLCDECDNAGFWDPNMALASFSVGATLALDRALELLKGRVEVLPDGKWLLNKFVAFQYGQLSSANPCHRQVLRILEARGCQAPTKGLPSPSGTGKGKGTEKGKGKGKGKSTPGGYHRDARTALFMLNEAAKVHFREVDSNLSVISQRLEEPEVTIDGVKKMIHRQVKRWKGTSMEPYLRPETLFRKSKFDSYYASREMPLPPDPEVNGHKQRQPDFNYADGTGDI